MNIIFDMGGVILSWQPAVLIERFFPDKTIQKKIWTDVFGHDDWQKYDQGILEPDVLLEKIVHRTGQNKEKIQEFLEAINHSLQPIPGTIALLYKLKSAGFKLYCISNINYPILEIVKRDYAFWEVFTGCVFSCVVKMIKPEAGIYRYLLNQYSLKAEECVFIDDLQPNAAAAAGLGIKTILFTNPEDCEKELNRILKKTNL